MKQALGALLALPLLLLFGCQNPGKWYPKAEAAVAGYSEYTDSGRKLAVTVSIHNTGQTAITSSTITIKAETDKREYLQTSAFAVRIIPGGKAAVTAVIAYYSAWESLADGSVKLYDAFFD